MNNIFGATSLIGGATGSLDSIDGNMLVNLDMAMTVVLNGRAYYHVLNATSGVAENSPYIISPDANAGTKRWILSEAFQSIGVGVSFESTEMPANDAIINLLMPCNITFPLNLVGSAYYAFSGPSAQKIITFSKNGASFGSLTVAQDVESGGVWTGITTSFLLGERLSIIFPSQDTTWSGIALTLKGVRI